jgi:signal transduction histidine kinase
MMKQVVANLLGNAIKYSFEETSILVVLKSQDEKVFFSVTNRGVGIPADDAERIFDPFHRGGNVSNIRGTGLGLSLAREFVRLHGGDISFESREGGETTFFVWFPAAVKS